MMFLVAIIVTTISLNRLAGVCRRIAWEVNFSSVHARQYQGKGLSYLLYLLDTILEFGRSR
jgi:hypothetical protein